MIQPEVVLSCAALGISALSLYLSSRLWNESNRPFITVRVEAHSDGNIRTPLNLIVENTGSRPALNVHLSVNSELLNGVLAATVPPTERSAIEACFDRKFALPVLANGASRSNAFGAISSVDPQIWKNNSRLPIMVTYTDLDRRCFQSDQEILIAVNLGFAQTWWKSDK
jgi:hypothetical protein